MSGMFEYLRDRVKARLGYSRESFGATVLLDWGADGAVLIDGTTPVPSNTTARGDTRADLTIRASADAFEAALDAGRTPGALDPAVHPSAYGLVIEGDRALWTSFGPRVLGAESIAPPQPAYPVTFPAMTAAQRLHFEAFGYVLIEDAIPRDLAARLVEEIRELQARADAGAFPDGTGASLYSNRHDYFRVLQPHLVSDAALGFVTNPRILGLAREATGGARIRYMEADCQIRRPNPLEADTPMISADGLHRGVRAVWGLELHGRRRAPFVKMLTNLTDLGPDDGGTVVVPGSHRSGLSVPEIVRALSRDPSMVRRVEAPAGSTLVFSEALVHGSGVIRSGRERLMMIAAYGPSFVQPSMTPTSTEGLWQRIDRAAYAPLFDGTDGWNWHPDEDGPALAG
jgi:ectoine hydroxylase-related dioxygenase (phytanoyl-CoA dioxygenase family)